MPFSRRFYVLKKRARPLQAYANRIQLSTGTSLGQSAQISQLQSCRNRPPINIRGGKQVVVRSDPGNIPGRNVLNGRDVNGLIAIGVAENKQVVGRRASLAIAVELGTATSAAMKLKGFDVDVEIREIARPAGLRNVVTHTFEVLSEASLDDLSEPGASGVDADRDIRCELKGNPLEILDGERALKEMVLYLHDGPNPFCLFRNYRAVVLELEVSPDLLWHRPPSDRARLLALSGEQEPQRLEYLVCIEHRLRIEHAVLDLPVPENHQG